MGTNAARVLIADSDLSLRQQVYGALLDHNIFSDCVGTTAAALEKMESEHYGVVILDIALPSGDVENVIARIAAVPIAQRPVVLVVAANPLSARTLDVEIVQIVLRRPVHLRQLVDVVRNCIRSATVRGPAGPELPSGQAIS